MMIMMMTKLLGISIVIDAVTPCRAHPICCS